MFSSASEGVFGRVVHIRRMHPVGKILDMCICRCVLFRWLRLGRLRFKSHAFELTLWRVVAFAQLAHLFSESIFQFFISHWIQLFWIGDDIVDRVEIGRIVVVARGYGEAVVWDVVRVFEKDSALGAGQLLSSDKGSLLRG